VPLQILHQHSENQIPLMQSGVVEELKVLLSNGSDKAKEHATRALGSISEERPSPIVPIEFLKSFQNLLYLLFLKLYPENVKYFCESHPIELNENLSPHLPGSNRRRILKGQFRVFKKPFFVVIKHHTSEMNLRKELSMLEYF